MVTMNQKQEVKSNRPPQSTSSKTKNPSKTVQQKEKDLTYRAIVLADSYDIHFYPITSKLPRCLFPILNRPVLCINLHQLQQSGFQDVIVFCTNHYDLIRSCLEKEGFITTNSDELNNKKKQLFQVRLFSNETAVSVGDALRDLADQGLIQNDFLLLFGDLITNVPFDEHIKLHRQLIEQDKRALLSMIYQNPLITENNNDGFGQKLLHWKTNDFQLILNGKNIFSNNDQTIANSITCREILHLNYDSNGLELPYHVITNVNPHIKSLRLVRNVYDPGVVMCEAYVATQFQDNYDYNSIADLIEGVLHNPEVLDKTVYAVGLKSASLDFCYRIEHLGLYKMICNHVMSRRVSNLLPLNNTFQLTPIQTNRQCNANYPHRKYQSPSFVYHPLENRSPISKASSQITFIGTIIFGQNCQVESKCHLENCQIGNECVIHQGVKLVNVICWNNVLFGNNCSIENSLICSNVQLMENCHVSENCVILPGIYSQNTNFPSNTIWSDGCQLQSINVNVEEFLSTIMNSTGDDKNNQKEEFENPFLRLEKRTILDYLQPPENGFKRKISNFNKSSATAVSTAAAAAVGSVDTTDFRAHSLQTDGNVVRDELLSDDDDDDDDDDDEAQEEEDDENLEEQKQFVFELQKTWLRIKKENVPWKNIVIEINSLKHAFAIEIDTLYMLLGRGLVDHAYKMVFEEDKTSGFIESIFKEKFADLLEICSPVIKHYITEDNEQNQSSFIYGIEEYLTERNDICESITCVNTIFHACYQRDIITEAVILNWREKSPLLADEELQPKLMELRNKLKQFFSWLEASSEEEESDEE